LNIVFGAAHKVKDLLYGPVDHGANVHIDHSFLLSLHRTFTVL
jgi:hypothetical protein